MSCLRRILPDFDFALARITYEQLARLEIQMNDFVYALRDVEPSATREMFVETPQVKWSEVGGLSPVKERLIETVEWPLQHEAVFAAARVRPAKGILLVGPPGCGKALLGKAVATQSRANFLSGQGPGGRV